MRPHRTRRPLRGERHGHPLDAAVALGVPDADQQAAVAGTGVADDGEVVDVEADELRGAQGAGPAEADEQLVAAHRRAAMVDDRQGDDDGAHLGEAQRRRLLGAAPGEEAAGAGEGGA